MYCELRSPAARNFLSAFCFHSGVFLVYSLIPCNNDVFTAMADTSSESEQEVRRRRVRPDDDGDDDDFASDNGLSSSDEEEELSDEYEQSSDNGGSDEDWEESEEEAVRRKRKSEGGAGKQTKKKQKSSSAKNRRQPSEKVNGSRARGVGTQMRKRGLRQESKSSKRQRRDDIDRHARNPFRDRRLTGEITKRKNGNIDNLRRHLQDHHSKVYEQWVRDGRKRRGGGVTASAVINGDTSSSTSAPSSSKAPKLPPGMYT